MSSLHIRLVAWNAGADPTRTKVTAVAAFGGGVACGHADGTIWLYRLARAAVDGPGDGKGEPELYPQCMLAGHRAGIALLRLAEISVPTADGREDALISVSADGDVAVWGTADGRCVARVQSPLAGIRPTAMCLQPAGFQQSAAEDQLFIAGEGRVAYVLSYPSLELAHEWLLPHPEWITALAVRRRRDHFRSELITCATDGVVRIWSFDDCGPVQHEARSRAASPGPDGAGDGADAAGSAAFSLESQFAALGAESAIRMLVVNPFNDDEFLAVSPKTVRLFASRSSELHELLRWRPQRSTDSSFTGGGFLAKSDIVFWDAVGTIYSVCTLFSVEGGSAGMHMARPQHDIGGRVHVAAGLTAVLPGSVLAGAASAASVLATYASSADKQTLSLVVPVPLSSVSGSANRPHTSPEDATAGPRNWLGRTALFSMGPLWRTWLQDVALHSEVTSVHALGDGRVAIGRADGAIHVAPPEDLIGGLFDLPSVGSSSGATRAVLAGHTGAVTALLEWCPLGPGLQPPREQLGLGGPEHPAEAAGCDSLLVSAGRDLTLRIWAAGSGECLCALPTQSAPVVALHAVGPDGGGAQGSLVLAVGSDNSATLVSVGSFERIGVAAPHHARPAALSLLGGSGALELRYADGARRQIAAGYPAAGSGQREWSIDLDAPAACGGDGRWLEVGLLGGLRRGAAAALAADVDVTQLHAVVSRTVGDGVSAEEMQRLLEQPDGQPLRAARELLARLCSWGISAELDAMKTADFGMQQRPRNVCLALANRVPGASTVSFPSHAAASASWCVSSLLNAQRTLAILVLAQHILQ
ncbi:hypothetical protein IWQ56_003506, partial [Coemansia nantahalensis]